jgi:hypothetical protein
VAAGGVSPPGMLSVLIRYYYFKIPLSRVYERKTAFFHAAVPEYLQGVVEIYRKQTATAPVPPL